MAQLCQPSACVFSWLDPVSFLWRQILWVVTHIGWIVQAAHAGVLKPVKAARQKYAEEENWSVKSTKTRIKIRLSSIQYTTDIQTLMRTPGQPTPCASQWAFPMWLHKALDLVIDRHNFEIHSAHVCPQYWNCCCCFKTLNTFHSLRGALRFYLKWWTPSRWSWPILFFSTLI